MSGDPTTSLDRLFEQALLTLYRCWYELPRRTTLPWLEKRRFELANALDAVDGNATMQSIDAHLVGFARSALTLPGWFSRTGHERLDAQVDEARELLRELAKTAASPSPGLRSASLRVRTDSSSARLTGLAELLREADPPRYAIGKMYYVDAELADAWQDLRGRLNAALPHVTAATQEQIAVVDDQLAASLQLSPTVHQAQDFYREALVALEQSSEVIRVLARDLLFWKTTTPQARRRSAGALFPEPGRLADARVEEYAGVAPPSAAAETWQEAMPGEETNRSIPLHTDLHFPRQVQRRQVQWLSVRLTLERPVDSLVDSPVAVPFLRGTNAEYVQVRVVAPDFTEATGVWERTIQVFPDRSSQPAVFLLRPIDSVLRGTQPARVVVDFYHAGRMVGSAAFVTEIVDRVATSRAVELELPDAGFGLPERNPPPPADLELRVLKAADANRLFFVLDSPLPEVGFHAQPMGEITLTEQNPMGFLVRQLDRLNQLAANAGNEPGETEQEALLQEIESLGEGLFEQLLPPQLQAAYWTRVKPLRDQGVIRTLLITSDEPWIPWELIKPYGWNRIENREYTDDFWVGSFVLTRWLAGRGPVGRVEVRAAALVMPEVGLSHLEAERRYFATLAQERNVEVGVPLQRRSDVLAALRLGGFQVLHVATHGNFDGEDVDSSQLRLIDDVLMPADLHGRGLAGIRRSRPLVFLNACHGGRTAFGITGLGGWAEKMFREAGVSAFVGALWEVNDELAVEFSQTFYRCLAEGQTLGEALLTARSHLRALNPANPTWLAYTLYGDPNAVIVMGG